MFQCRENLNVLVEHHPYHENLNKKILQDSLEFNFVDAEQSIQRGGDYSNVRALQTIEGVITSKSIDLIYEWIANLIRKEYRGWNYRVGSSWLARYDKGNYAVSHDHIPAAFSFVYFVKCPKGSAPLVFTTSGKRIKAEDGKVLIFPGNMKHHVPTNKSDGRMVLAGNMVMD